MGQAKVPIGRGRTTLAEMLPNKMYYARPHTLLADADRNLWMYTHVTVSEQGVSGESLILGRDSKGVLHVWPLPNQVFELDSNLIHGSYLAPVDEVHFDVQTTREWDAIAVLKDRS